MSNSGERSRPVRFTALRAALGWIVSALTLGGCVSFPPLTQFVQRPPDVEVVRTVDRTLASGVLVDEDFAIGGFRVEGVDRGGFLQTKPYRSRGTFTFALVSDASKLAATCTVFGAGLGRRLECRCAAEDGSSEL